MTMDDNDEAQLTLWYEILEQVVNGHTAGSCPFCGTGVLDVKVEGRWVRVRCTSCGKFFEGQLP
jgi:hypothetical protein